MKRFAILAGVVLAIALPAAALANPADNPSLKDAVGFCVSAGNYNYHAVGETTGQDRSGLTGQEVKALMAQARSDGFICTTFQENGYDWQAPGQAGK